VAGSRSAGASTTVPSTPQTAPGARPYAPPPRLAACLHKYNFDKINYQNIILVYYKLLVGGTAQADEGQEERPVGGAGQRLAEGGHAEPVAVPHDAAGPVHANQLAALGPRNELIYHPPPPAHEQEDQDYAAFLLFSLSLAIIFPALFLFLFLNKQK
jgi:hypothetical protein